jgi:hypothetical protein
VSLLLFFWKEKEVRRQNGSTFCPGIFHPFLVAHKYKKGVTIPVRRGQPLGRGSSGPLLPISLMEMGSWAGSPKRKRSESHG